jgi:hypothetical protein
MATSSLSFGNITRDGDRRATDLAGQAVELVSRKIVCEQVDRLSQLRGALPQ